MGKFFQELIFNNFLIAFFKNYLGENLFKETTRGWISVCGGECGGGGSFFLFW